MEEVAYSLPLRETHRFQELFKELEFHQVKVKVKLYDGDELTEVAESDWF